MKKIKTTMKIFGIIAIPLVIFYYAFSKYSIGEVFLNKNPISIGYSILVITTFSIIINIFQAMRLKNCLLIYKLNLDLIKSWEICQIGGIYGYTPLGFMLGDSIRIKLIANNTNAALILSSKPIIIDRILGLFGLFSTSIIIIISLILNLDISQILLIYTIITILLIILKIKAKLNLSIYIYCYLLSPIMSSMIPFGTIILIKLLLININAINLLVATIISQIASLLPLSIGGFGIRDAAFLIIFNHYNLDGANSLLISTIIGFSILFGFIPGLIYAIAKKIINLDH